MAMIWADGFDHYGETPNGGRDAMLAGAWAQFSAGNGTLPFVSDIQQRTGDYSLCFSYNQLATDGVKARRVLGGAQIVVGCAMGWYFTSLPVANAVHGFEWRNNSNAAIVSVFVQSDGSIGIYSGASRTLVGASDPIISAGSWQHIEGKIVCDSVVGEVEVRVNGLTVVHFTDLNLGALGSTQMVFGMPDLKSGTSLDYFLDDIVAWNDTGDVNNSFIGVQRVDTVFAVADTAQTDWVRNTGSSDYAAIDNVPPDGDTTYLLSDTAGDISEFTLGTLPPETEIIAGIYIPAMARLEDAGTGNIQISLVSGGEVSEGPDQVLTTAYQYWGGVHEVDPDTDGAWTKAAVEAAILRIEKTV